MGKRPKLTPLTVAPPERLTVCDVAVLATKSLLGMPSRITSLQPAGALAQTEWHEAWLVVRGAAALVPKKFGLPLPSLSKPKNVVSPPSGAVMSGVCRMTGEARRLPAVSKRIGVPPAEEKDSTTGGLTP